MLELSGILQPHYQNKYNVILYLYTLFAVDFILAAAIISSYDILTFWPLLLFPPMIFWHFGSCCYFLLRYSDISWTPKHIFTLDSLNTFQSLWTDSSKQLCMENIVTRPVNIIPSSTILTFHVCHIKCVVIITLLW